MTFFTKELTMFKAPVIVTLAALSIWGCRHEERAEPGDAYGCISSASGKDLDCREFDASSTRDERLVFAKACTATFGNIKGRLVRHCAPGAVASCSLPAEKQTQLFSKDQAGADAMRGARIGCQMRGGTFVGP